MNRLLQILGVIALIALLVSFPFWLPPYYLTTSVRILFYSMLAISLSFLAGQGGMVSLAQTAFFGFSAYVLAILSLRHGVPFPYPELLGVAGATLLAVIFGLIATRTSGVYYIMITLSLGQLAWALASQWTSVSGGFTGIQGVRAPVVAGIPFTEPRYFYWALLVIFLICFVIFRAIIRSPFGLALRG